MSDDPALAHLYTDEGTMAESYAAGPPTTEATLDALSTVDTSTEADEITDHDAEELAVLIAGRAEIPDNAEMVALGLGEIIDDEDAWPELILNPTGLKVVRRVLDIRAGKIITR